MEAEVFFLISPAGEAKLVFMNNILKAVYFGNSIQDWLTAVVILLVSVLIILFFKKRVLAYLKKWASNSKTTLDDFLLVTIEKSVLPLFYLGAFSLALKALAVSAGAAAVIHVAVLFFATFFVLRVITSIARQFVFSFIKTEESNEIKEKQARGLLLILNIVIWLLGIIFIIDNLGYNVTTLITGLGIGGIAIALAAQTILGDLFSYFSIFFDRPFEIGDFITVDDKAGTVEYVGIKTTRLRTLGGEQMICSNTDLTNARVHNYKRMEQRRVVFKLRALYQTEAQKAKQIPEIVKGIIERETDVRFDRGHFSAFGDYSLDFEFVYYVLSADYNVYMDKQQAIYFNILTKFEEEKICFAYPTQTIFTNNPDIAANEREEDKSALIYETM